MRTPPSAGGRSRPIAPKVPYEPGFLSADVMNALRKCTGTGKIVVELFSVAISASVEGRAGDSGLQQEDSLPPGISRPVVS